MARADLLKKLFSSYKQNDTEMFYSVASEIIEDEKKKTSYMAYCLKWQRRVFRETIIKEAQSIYPIAMENFDTDIYAFNCQNETLHLNTKITVIIHHRMWQGWLEFVSPIYQNLAVDLYSMLLR